MALLDGLDGSNLGLIATLFGVSASVATVFGAGWKLGDKLGRAKADKEITKLKEDIVAAENAAGSLRGKLKEIEQLVSGDISYWVQPADVNGYFKKITASIPVLMIANFKGGVGKTTLAANLAAYFEKVAKKRVLLIDFDYQGSLSDTVLPHGIEKLEFSANLLIDPRVDQASIIHRSQTLRPALDKARVYPAFYDLNKVENRVMFSWLVQPDSPDVRYNLLSILHRPEFQHAFDLVIIDAPPRLMTATVNAACAATHFLIPTVLDHLSVSAALNTLGVFRELKSKIAPCIQPLGFVPTMVASDMRLAPVERIALRELDEGRAEFWKQAPLPEIFADSYISRKVAINRTAGQEIAYLKDEGVEQMFNRLGKQLEARLFHAGEGTERGFGQADRASVAVAS